MSKSQVKASMKYNKLHTKQVKLTLNTKTDADIIRHLDNVKHSKMGYIKNLIRKDMNG